MINTSMSAAAESTVYRRIDLRVVGFLAVCYAFAYLDRVNIGFAKLRMQDELAFSDAVYGLGAGIFFIGYVLFEVPSNLLLVRIGARKTLSRIMILWGLTSSSMYLVSDVTSFYTLRFLLGVFEAGFAPGAIYYLTCWYPRRRIARALAMLLCAAPIGGVIGAPVSGWMLSAFDGLGGMSSWQWMFIFEGVPAVLLGLIAFFWLDDTPRHARWLTSEERQYVLAQVCTDPCRSTELPMLRGALMDFRIWKFAATYFCLISGLYAVGFWLPAILKSMGIVDSRQIGAISGLPYLAAAAAMFLLARSSDLRNERRWHSTISALIAAVAFTVAVIHISNPAVAIAAITLATAGVYAAYSVFWAMPSEVLSGASSAAGIALINTLGLTGGFVSPTLIGWASAMTGNISAGLYVIVALLFLGACILLTLPERERGRFSQT
jgi:sugar phosphate permease